MDYRNMSFAELRAAKITTPMPTAQLYERIVKFLSSVNVCVLTTCKNNIPRATPIEYYSEGTTIYMTVDPGTKIENLKANPQVSIGIYSTPYTDWTNWADVVGVQLTGTSTLIKPTEPAYEDAMKIYQWHLYAKARGWDLTKHPTRSVICKVVASKVEFRDLALLKEGLNATQVWEAGK